MPRCQASQLVSLALLGLFVVCAIIAFWGPGVNADWSAYETLYLGEGSWLADQGRDFGFLTLTQSLRSVIDYEAFRLLLAFYFAAFTFWIVGAWGSQAVFGRCFLYGFALLPLLYPRVTVQVREGLAVTLVLAALAISSRRVIAQRPSGVFPLILMLLAGTIHAAASIWLVIMYFPRVFFALRKQRALLCIGVVVIVIAIFALVDTGIGSALVLGALEGGWSGFELTETTSDSSKVIYWASRTAGVAYLVYLIKYHASGFDIHTRRFLKLSGYLLVPALQLLVMWLIFSGQNSLVASSGIRALNMVFLLLLAVVGLRARMRLPLLVFVVLFLYDQHRVLIAHLN
jgi:hypothetical protein